MIWGIRRRRVRAPLPWIWVSFAIALTAIGRAPLVIATCRAGWTFVNEGREDSPWYRK